MKKNTLLLALTFCIIALTSACNDEGNSPVSTNSVVGCFIADDGTPISNAIVEATDGKGELFSTSTTNDLGSFEVKNVPENTDNAIVSFIKDGTVIKQIKLETLLKIAEKSGKADILLSEDYDYEAVFGVKVIDIDTDAPIGNATVRLSTSGNAMFEATTDSTGYAYLPQVVPGMYFIRIAHNYYKTLEKELLLLFPEGWDTVRFTFKLTAKDNNNGGNDSNYYDTCCNNSISVKVIDTTKSGVILANCKVTLVNTLNKTHIEKTTNKDGWVEFTDLCAGRYEVYVSEDAYKGYGFAITLYCDNHEERIIGVVTIPKKCCDNVLIVHYKDQNGNPIKNCEYAILTCLENPSHQKADLVNGTAIFKELCNDRTYMQTTVGGCDGYYFGSLTPNNTGIKFDCKDTVEKTITLQRYDTLCCRNSIKISVLDSVKSILDTTKSITPIQDADVEIQQWQNNTKVFSVKAKFLNGVYIAEGLCTGRYAIRIVACGKVKEDTFEVICDDHIYRAFLFDCP